MEIIQVNDRVYTVHEHYHKTTKTNNLVSRVTDKSNDEICVIKRPRNSLIQESIELYYVFQDLFFFGSRVYRSAKQRIQNEKETLELLKGLRVPRLIDYDQNEPAIVRSYIPGTPFRELEDPEDYKKTFEGALELFQQIHERKGVVGDGHPKNLILDAFGKVHWTGFAAVYDYDPHNWESIEKAQAIDILKLVYLAHHAMGKKVSEKDKKEIIWPLASKASRYPIERVQDKIKELSEGQKFWQCNYFATRLPKSGDLELEILMTLRGLLE